MQICVMRGFIPVLKEKNLWERGGLSSMKNILAIVCAAVFFCWMPKGAEGDTLKQGIAAYKGKDYTAALKIIRPLAIKGGARAQFYLGLMYEEGDGVAKDIKEAVKW